MANNTELIAQCEAKAKQWLSPAFDEETQREVKAQLEAEDKTCLLYTSRCVEETGVPSLQVQNICVVGLKFKDSSP